MPTTERTPHEIVFRNLSPDELLAALEQSLRDNPPPTEYDLLLERARRNRAIAELMKLEITI